MIEVDKHSEISGHVTVFFEEQKGGKRIEH